MKNLLTLNYWFNLRPEPLTPMGQKIFIGTLLLVLVLTVVLWILKRRGGLYRGFLKRLYGYSLTNFTIGLIIFFFVYELVPFLAARFWLGLWGMTAIIWLGFILKDLKKIPEQKKQREKANEFNKYIPK